MKRWHSSFFKCLVATCHSFLRFFIFLSDDTLQDITSHNFLYDEAGVYKWSCCGITWITSHTVVVIRLGQVRFYHGIGGLKVTVSSRIFWSFSPTGTQTCAPHIRGSSRAVSEWYPAYLRQLIIQTVHILQLDSAVTDSLPRGSVVRSFQPYFPIT